MRACPGSKVLLPRVGRGHFPATEVMAMKSPEPHAGPLSPYRVLDLADLKGDFCTRSLADLGADQPAVTAPGRPACAAPRRR